jgi:hypothetical protein
VIKRFKRHQKNSLIEQTNPEWLDLFDTLWYYSRIYLLLAVILLAGICYDVLANAIKLKPKKYAQRLK